MNYVLRLLTVALVATFISGCGTILATFEADTIEEDPGERTVAEQVLDESIETKAIVNIRAADDAFDEASFIVVSFNGYVLLAGEVQTEALKVQAAEVLRRIEGVRRIYNELQVGPNSDGETEANDIWITTKVKAELLTASNTPSTRVKVTTENSVVYLMGLLTPEEAERVAKEAAGVTGVKRVVQLFELI